MIKSGKSPTKDTRATFYFIIETKVGQATETILPLLTCTTLERAKMVQLATPVSFMPSKRENFTHRFYCPCNTTRSAQHAD